MRKIILSLILVATAQIARATPVTCGVYLIEVYPDVEIRSLTNLTSRTGRQVHFAISNPESDPVRTMISGLCYCVSGETKPDPAFNGDSDFHLIEVQSVIHRCNSAL